MEETDEYRKTEELLGESPPEMCARKEKQIQGIPEDRILCGVWAACVFFGTFSFFLQITNICWCQLR